jgi:hypothetical protein
MLPECCHDWGGFLVIPEDVSGRLNVRNSVSRKGLSPEVSRRHQLRMSPS